MNYFKINEKISRNLHNKFTAKFFQFQGMQFKGRCKRILHLQDLIPLLALSVSLGADLRLPSPEFIGPITAICFPFVDDG